MRDLSNKIILVLVLLTVLASVFSTWLLLANSTTDVPISQTGQLEDRSTSYGKVKFSIMKEPEPAFATGRVTFSIKS